MHVTGCVRLNNLQSVPRNSRLIVTESYDGTLLIYLRKHSLSHGECQVLSRNVTEFTSGSPETTYAFHLLSLTQSRIGQTMEVALHAVARRRRQGVPVASDADLGCKVNLREAGLPPKAHYALTNGHTDTSGTISGHGLRIIPSIVNPYQHTMRLRSSCRSGCVRRR